MMRCLNDSDVFTGGVLMMLYSNLSYFILKTRPNIPKKQTLHFLFLGIAGIFLGIFWEFFLIPGIPEFFGIFFGIFLEFFFHVFQKIPEFWNFFFTFWNFF